MMDLASSFNSALESAIYIVGGASFDKNEFKRNVAGRVAYAPLFMVDVSSRKRQERRFLCLSWFFILESTLLLVRACP